MLTEAEQAGRKPYPDDEECQRRFDAFMKDAWPRIVAGELPIKAAKAPKSKPITIDTPGNPTLEQIASYYTETILPNKGAAAMSIELARDSCHQVISRLATLGVHRAGQLRDQRAVLQEVITSLRKAYAASTTKLHLDYFRAACAIAYADNLIDTPIMRKWPTVKVKKKAPPAKPSPQGYAGFWAVLKKRFPHHWDITRFIWLTGVRSIDAQRLEWDRIIDLDGPRPIAHIRQHKTGDWVAIPLSMEAVEILRRQRLRKAAGNHVFTDARGKPFNAGSVYYAISTAAKAAGIHLSTKGGRQHVVTSLIEAGASKEDIAKITGHKSDAIYDYMQEEIGARHDLAQLIEKSLNTPVTLTPPVTPLTKSRRTNE